MATISVSLPSDGTNADVGDHNTPINTIVTEINGNLDNANIKTGAAISGAKLAADSVTSSQIDFGGAGAGVWWEEIGRATASSNVASITTGTIVAKKFLRIIAYVNPSASTGRRLQFNGDAAANYASRFSANNAADATETSNSAGIPTSVTATTPSYTVVDVVNVATLNKITTSIGTIQNTAGAGTAPDKIEISGKWANTSDQITSVQLVASLASGSELIVLGHD